MVIKLDNIKFAYEENTPVIRGVSFSITKGEYVCIIGHNGSGKSTLSRIMMGLLEADEGDIFIKGEKLTYENYDSLRTALAIVFQNPDSQFIGTTVEDDVAFGLENKQIPQEEMLPIIDKYLSLVGMTNFRTHEPHLLSGGQKQRVAIASALAMQPEIIIFDESTSMLDPKGKSEVKALMSEIGRDKDITLISITHDMDELLNCDRVIVLNKGEVMYNDKPLNVLKHQKELEEMQLGVPTILDISRKLKSKGVKETTSMEELVKQLCKLK